MEGIRVNLLKSCTLATLLVLLFSGCVIIPYPPGATVSVATEDGSLSKGVALSVEEYGLIGRFGETIGSKSERIDFVDPSEYREVLFQTKITVCRRSLKIGADAAY